MEVVVHVLNSEGSVKAVLSHATFDIAVGESENDFELSFTDILPDGVTVTPGDMWCVNQTEYGGVIDSVRDDDGETIYSGRAWSGLLENKIVEPESGEDYYILSGDVAACLRQLFKHVKLSGFVTVAQSTPLLTVSNVQLPRYCTAYDAAQRLLAKANAVLNFYYDIDAKQLRVTAITQQVATNLYNAVHLDVTVNKRVVNHLIGLGKGELKDRLVLHAYADTTGEVSDNQSLYGVDEITAVYEMSNEDDADKLKADLVKKLQEYQELLVAKISLGDSDREFTVGDKISAQSSAIRVMMEATVAKKITQLKDGVLSSSYTLSDKQQVSTNY